MIDVAQHTRLARYAAIRYRPPLGRALEPEDLYQEACLGLMRAARTFDPAIARWATYALPWARQFMQRAAMNGGATVRLPVHVQERRRRAGMAMRVPCVSLDAPPRGSRDERTLGDLLPDPDAEQPDVELERAEAKTQLAELVHRARLTARERRVLRLRAAEATLDEVAAELSLSRERIRQIEFESLRKLRSAAGVTGVTGGLAAVAGITRRRRDAA